MSGEIKNLWWGYLHTSGTVQVKRYFGPLDTQEAHESPFCARVFEPFEAKDRTEAIEIIKQTLLNTDGCKIK